MVADAVEPETRSAMRDLCTQTLRPPAVAASAVQAIRAGEVWLFADGAASYRRGWPRAGG